MTEHAEPDLAFASHQQRGNFRHSVARIECLPVIGPPQHQTGIGARQDAASMIPDHGHVHDSASQLEARIIAYLKRARRAIQDHHMLLAARPQATLLIRQPLVPGVFWYTLTPGNQLNSLTCHAAVVMAATVPQRALRVDKAATELSELRKCLQLLRIEVGTTVPFGAAGRHPQLQQSTAVEHPHPVLSGREQSKTIIDIELAPTRPHSAKPVAVAHIQITGLANPQSPGTVFQDAMYKRAFDPFGIAEALEAATVLPEKPILGANPDEAVAILHQRSNRQVG